MPRKLKEAVARNIKKPEPKDTYDEAMRTLVSKEWPLVSEIYAEGRMAEEGTRYRNVVAVPDGDMVRLADADGNSVTAAVQISELAVSRRGGTGLPAILRLAGRQAGFRQVWLFFSQDVR